MPNAPLSVISIAPITLSSSGRDPALQIRISAPVTGQALPVILFSHGNGQSLHTYGPLVHHWASHGFTVIQPTHLDSRTIGIPHDDTRWPLLWKHREDDLGLILDRLSEIADAVPAIGPRMDLSCVAVAGHSWGAQTASMLLGATHPDPRDGSTVAIADARVRAGILLTVPGMGDALTPFAREHLPFMVPDFAGMTTPALIVMGDEDQSMLTTKGPEWWREAYDHSPGAKTLLTLHGAEHSLGGISNYEAKETTDENPARVAELQKVTTAWLKHALGRTDHDLDTTVVALKGGEIEMKGA